MKKIYGYELILDLYDCNSKIIRSKKKLQEYVEKLCQIIKMKKYGKTFVARFGENNPHTKGYSLVQLIETSSITGHFSELWASAHMNIFSCKKFNDKKISSFSKDFFQAKRMSRRHILRKVM